MLDPIQHVALMVVVLDHANGYLAQAESLGMQPMEQFNILIDMGDEEMELLAGFNIFDADRARNTAFVRQPCRCLGHRYSLPYRTPSIGVGRPT